MQTLTRSVVGDAAAGLSLHFLHMSEGPFSHDAGQLYTIYTISVKNLIYAYFIIYFELLWMNVELHNRYTNLSAINHYISAFRMIELFIDDGTFYEQNADIGMSY